MEEQIAYLTIDEVIFIHQKTVERSGGGDIGYINLGSLESVLQNIQNDEYYPSFVEKLTHLFYCICEFHCFTDGNKRLAIAVSAGFLLSNGYMAVASTFFSKMENISYHVAAGRIKKDLLQRILQAILDNSYEDDESLKLEILNAISE